MKTKLRKRSIYYFFDSHHISINNKLVEKLAPHIEYMYWKLLPAKLYCQIHIENYAFTRRLFKPAILVYQWLMKSISDKPKYKCRVRLRQDLTDADLERIFNQTHIIGAFNNMSGSSEIKEIIERMQQFCEKIDLESEKRRIKKYARLRRVHAQRAWLLRQMPIALRMLF